MHASQPEPKLQRFFSGITEYAFQTRLGVVDPPLVDYVSHLLVRFLRNDSIYKVRNLRGRKLTEIVEMVREGEARKGEARRAVHRHVGDFILFWTGLYPESVKGMQSSDEIDTLVDYCEQGKRSYFIASTIQADETRPSGEVLQRLSHDFDLCVYGLGEVRREWERRDDGETPGPYLIN
jgi:hypothetical protein